MLHVSATPLSVFHVSHQRLEKFLFNEMTTLQMVTTAANDVEKALVFTLTNTLLLKMQ